jgi:LysM repeat protein
MAIIKNGTVKVQKGDTLSGIAAKAKTTVSAIAKANGITNVNMIKPGQVFTLPGKAATAGTGQGAVGTEVPGSGDERLWFPGLPGGETYGPFMPTTDADTGTGAGTNNTTAKVDAIAAITALLKSYGLGDLSTAVTEAVQKGYSADTINLMMQDPNGKDPLAVAFQTRFPANKARAAAGKSVLSPSEYLSAERRYTEVMKSYGVANLATRDKLNSFITNDISATEVADRVGLAVNRVQNADADTKAALALYYPSINQTDIVSALLDPTEGLPALQRKIQISEIGGAAIAAGLKKVDATGALEKINIQMGQEALANLGVTKEQARAGFQQVAEITPRADFLSEISPGENYGQLQAEQEAFQGLASAKRARLSLTAQEQARFGGSAGTTKGSLASQSRGSF